jgi:hypothetical protein
MEDNNSAALALLCANQSSRDLDLARAKCQRATARTRAAASNLP